MIHGRALEEGGVEPRGEQHPGMRPEGHTEEAAQARGPRGEQALRGGGGVHGLAAGLSFLPLAAAGEPVVGSVIIPTLVMPARWAAAITSTTTP